uniref:alpha/beta fold hydrolase n=1 Tax=Marinobacterium profundum TaxID=1714300 RepID=UPI00082ED570|nr:alpha/beta fold hydrolase [Marinobacterium profundum]
MRIAIEGGSLFVKVDEAQQKGAPWLMLSNSIAADHTMWDGQVPLLTKRYNVLRYDARGHGLSDAPPGPYSFALLVKDIISILDHLDIERTSFMGLSLGGMTALGLALEHPERLDKLVCCDARADAPEPFVNSWVERIGLIEKFGLKAILNGTVERWLVPSFVQSHPDEVARIEAMIMGTSPAGWIGCAEALKQLDYLKDLAAIKVPTLFVAGAEDGGAPLPVMQAMTNAVAGAELVVVPNAAHLSNLDNPEGFNSAISGFLEVGA